MAKTEGNGGLPTLAVSRAMLATAPGRRKLDLILNANDPRAFVRRLPAEDLYFAMREIGLADAAEVVGLASPQQFRAFVDLDAWDRDLPVPTRVLSWLRLAREGASNIQAFRRQRQGLDPETVLLVLRTQARVHSLEENDSPVLESNDFLTTAEGKYLVEITAESDEDRATVRLLLEDLIDENPFEATRLFEAVRWESLSELEESLLRWRTGRLRDMGFPDLEEAMHIWRPLPQGWKAREAAPDSGPIAGVPAMLLAGSQRRLLLDRVTEQLSDEARSVFNEGLLYLLNCSLVADGIEPRDLDRARPSIEAARDMLSLGLELASDGDEGLAVRILGTTPAIELFRRAVTEVLDLSRRASSIASRVPAGPAGSTLLDSPDAELLSGLRKRRPRFHLPPEGPRGFRDRGDIASARAGLERAEEAARVLERLGVLPQLEEIAEASNRATTAVTISQLALTSVARALLGGTGPLAPLDAEQVSKLCAFFQEGKLTPDAGAKVSTLLGEYGANLLAPDWTRRLEEEVGQPCARGGIDARFVECLLVRPG